jgi:hypothetical protein
MPIKGICLCLLEPQDGGQGLCPSQGWERLWLQMDQARQVPGWGQEFGLLVPSHKS